MVSNQILRVHDLPYIPFKSARKVHGAEIQDHREFLHPYLSRYTQMFWRTSDPS